ncbi:FAD-binding oxidoreductase [Pseudonocardia sp. CA-142604]|uniref:FAD-binding oxidoreductase n=1 Tax=Pseudonocardia sp. CA-142604 TaxID=3240024 RepID=UPI003D8AF4DB
MTWTQQVQGPVFRPGDSEFDEETSGFQTAYKHRPAYVVAATGADDVRAALAGADGLPVAVQATGHGRTLPLDGGVLISTRRMTGLRIDPGRRSAWIEAGVRWRQVITAAAEHGLAPLSGSSPEVGAVGYILGGGLGVLARRYGYAADHVSSIDLAAADGSLRHVTAGDDPDLFRELRGAGHGLGVVTAMEIGLVPVTRLYGGGLYVDGPHVPELLEAYRDWTVDLPDELTSSIALITYPDMAGVPELLRGRYAAHVRIAFAGPTAQGERLVAPLRAAVPLLRDTLGELPFTQSASIYNDPAWPHSYGGTNAMLRELDPAALRDIVELAGPGAPVPCIVQLNHLGGALARPPVVPNAVGHRDAAYLVRVLSVLGDPAAASRAHSRLLDALAPWTVGRSRNFLFGQPWADQAGAVVSGTA